MIAVEFLHSLPEPSHCSPTGPRYIMNFRFYFVMDIGLSPALIHPLLRNEFSSGIDLRYDTVIKGFFPGLTEFSISITFFGDPLR